eukprot:TRINITY_DN22251_c0_g1_i1.p1 TRINITY_DN22251_c0_g1~~TRINITY_DN22251_c0_g1_i1.p1  ORF type:complete len:498 (-),score=206.71 TRINITY_DN22251_c0_g1_i1:170-1663(-)
MWLLRASLLLVLGQNVSVSALRLGEGEEGTDEGNPHHGTKALKQRLNALLKPPGEHGDVDSSEGEDEDSPKEDEGEDPKPDEEADKAAEEDKQKEAEAAEEEKKKKLENPMAERDAYSGRSDDEVLASLPEEMQKAIKLLKPETKGSCKGSSLIETEPLAEDDEGDDEEAGDGESDTRSLLQPRRTNSGKGKSKRHRSTGEPEKCECPASGSGDHHENDKYQERADGSGCDGDKGMWNGDAGPMIRFKYEAVARLFKLKNKDFRVLDWGSGCGHQLDIIAKENGFQGVGFDLIEKNMEWAKSHLKNIHEFCTLDGSGGLPFGEGSFDVVMGNGAIHHVGGGEPNFDAQCKLLKEQVPRVLTKNGCAWFGYINAGAAPSFPEEEMMGCFNDTEGKLVAAAVNEQTMFGCSEYDSESSYSIVLCKVDSPATKAEGKDTKGKEAKEEHPPKKPKEDDDKEAKEDDKEPKVEDDKKKTEAPPAEPAEQPPPATEKKPDAKQ